MSKKNSSVILKNNFKEFSELYIIYKLFEKKVNSLKKKKLLVAVSGGPDSLALTALSKSFALKNNFNFYYALVDHSLRKNSAKEAEGVKKLLKKHGLKLYILKNKRKIKKNIQGEARAIRYELLTKFCEKNKIKFILTAHHLEDQVETFFIRLSRGSGLDGLSSMKFISNLNKNVAVVRPLLEFKKKHLISFSKKIFGKYYVDPSNNDHKYLRTRVRKLKDFLEKSGISYNQIFKSINNLASSRDTLNFYLTYTYQKIVSKKNNKILINFKSFNNLNKEMKMKILSRSFKDFNGSYYSLRSKKILNLIDKIDADSNLKYTLSGCVIFRDNRHIILKKDIK